MKQDKTSLRQCLTPERCLILDQADKRLAVEQLVKIICADVEGGLDPKTTLEAVWNRECNLPTRLVPGVAIPHARVDALPETMVAVGISPEGIQWDAEENQPPVRLAIVIIGPGSRHLQVLAQLATRLSNQPLYETLLDADDPKTVYQLLTQPYSALTRSRKPSLQDSSQACFRHALTLAREMDASTIVLHADAVGNLAFLDNCQIEDLELIVVARDLSRYRASDKITRFLPVPFSGLNRSSQMDVAFLFLVSQGILDRGKRVVSVCGLPDSGLLDTIMTTNLQEEYRHFVADPDQEKLPEDVEPQVLSRVLQVASSLAAEGREGKPVGTIFVIGDYQRVSQHCRQMVINPFKGYPEEDLNILDPGLEETIKEFSRIDGAFLLRGDGVAMAAGAYIRTMAEIEELTPGLGARHAAAASITRQSRALSVAVSESTRKTSLFRNGERILEI